MLNCNTAATLMNLNEKLQLEDGEDMTDARRFRSLVGGPIYRTHTIPDLAFSVEMFSKFMQQPSKAHLAAAKRILRYVVGTSYGIWYTKTTKVKLYGYSDNDWASSIDDKRSIFASVFSLGSDVITWSSKKQRISTLFTIEAEHVSVSIVACQVIWLRRTLPEFQHKQTNPTELFCDNRRTTCLTKILHFMGEQSISIFDFIS